jgi:organic radical activating enzyme
MKLAVENPNFSIIVPTGCNAKCEFCFWSKPEGCLQGVEYLRRLNDVLQELPKEFTQCSITGGEPTTSPILREILVLVRMRFEKVVMSSNGYNIEPWVFDYIDHLNISRHDYNDENNNQVFQTDTVPTGKQLRSICATANTKGVDVTLNTVLSTNFNDKAFIYEMIEFSKSVWANAICFRKEHSDIEPMPVEEDLNWKITYEHSCGVCTVKDRFIRGFKTTWRYSVLEPSKALNGVYELVFHGDGKLTSDWEAEDEVTIMYVQDHYHIEARDLKARLFGTEVEDTDAHETAEDDMFEDWEEEDEVEQEEYVPSMRVMGCGGGMPQGCG